MALTKNKMVSEIGRRTRLRNHDVQRMLEALIDVWIEELASGGRIELAELPGAGSAAHRPGRAAWDVEYRRAAPGDSPVGGPAQQETEDANKSVVTNR